MNNVENFKGFELINARALAGELNAQKYADKLVELEFVALKKTSALLLANPLTLITRDTDRFHNWMLSNIGTVNEYKSAFDKPGMTANISNYEAYTTYYKSYISPRLKPNVWAQLWGSEASRKLEQK